MDGFQSLLLMPRDFFSRHCGEGPLDVHKLSWVRCLDKRSDVSQILLFGEDFEDYLVLFIFRFSYDHYFVETISVVSEVEPVSWKEYVASLVDLVGERKKHMRRRLGNSLR